MIARKITKRKSQASNYAALVWDICSTSARKSGSG